ncbi:MAG: potassium channel family protein, partial [archaeon]|nr:potassium channel family protein [archaeon]
MIKGLCNSVINQRKGHLPSVISTEGVEIKNDTVIEKKSKRHSDLNLSSLIRKVYINKEMGNNKEKLREKIHKAIEELDPNITNGFDSVDANDVNNNNEAEPEEASNNNSINNSMNNSENKSNKCENPEEDNSGEENAGDNNNSALNNSILNNKEGFKRKKELYRTSVLGIKLSSKILEMPNEDDSKPSVPPMTTRNHEDENKLKDNLLSTTLVNAKISNEVKDYLEIKIEEGLKKAQRKKSVMKMIEEYEQDQKEREEEEEEDNFDTINKLKEEDLKIHGKYKRYIKFCDLTMAILVLANIFFTVIHQEIYSKKTNDYLEDNDYKLCYETLKKIPDREISLMENFLRFLNIGISIACVVLMSLKYKYMLKGLKIDRKLSKFDTFYTSGLYKLFILEIFIVCLFLPPFINVGISGEQLQFKFIYTISAIFGIVVLIKGYLVIKIYHYLSRWTSRKAQTIGERYNVKIGFKFAFKAELKKRPYTILVVTLFVVVVILSYMVRCFEYTVIDQDNLKEYLRGDHELQDMQNCVWMIIITMLTVGYGDIYPRSHLGRITVMISSILGNIIVSLIVVSLAVLTEFSAEEKKAYGIIKKIQADSNAFQKAALVISDICQLRYLIMKSQKALIKENTLGKKFILITQLKRDISNFKNDFKIAASFGIPLEEMLNYLETKFGKDIKELTEVFEELNNKQNSLKDIESKQIEMSQKMDIIHQRQKKIAEYIIKLNNENYLKALERRNKRRKEEENKEEVKNKHIRFKDQIDGKLDNKEEKGKKKRGSGNIKRLKSSLISNTSISSKELSNRIKSENNIECMENNEDKEDKEDGEVK